MKGLAGLSFTLGVVLAAVAAARESATPFVPAAFVCLAVATLAWNLVRRRGRDRLVALRGFRARRERR
jgi:hypothetical protein